MDRRLLLAGVFGLGCARVSDEQPFAREQPPLEMVETIPEQGARRVSPTVQVDLCFSGLIDPAALDDFDLTLRSGSLLFDSQLTMQLIPWRDPGGAPASADGPWCPGSVVSLLPKSPLDAGVLYRAQLRPAPVGWAGQTLSTGGPGWAETADGARRFHLEFTVGQQDPEVPEDRAPDPLRLTDLFAEGGPLDPDRGLCGCHTLQGPGRDPLAYQRLDLSSPTTAYQALVIPTRARDTGFPMISPRHPSESFLIHKLLREPDDQAIFGVLGEPMPPTEPIPYRDLVKIAQWIEAGALP